MAVDTSLEIMHHIEGKTCSSALTQVIGNLQSLAQFEKWNKQTIKLNW